MAERFIEFNQCDDAGLVLIEVENVVAIQKKLLPSSYNSIGPRSFVYLRNSNIFFVIADTVENIRRLVEKKW